MNCGHAVSGVRARGRRCLPRGHAQAGRAWDVVCNQLLDRCTGAIEGHAAEQKPPLQHGVAAGLLGRSVHVLALIVVSRARKRWAKRVDG
jgi:hypothetical protein